MTKPGFTTVFYIPDINYFDNATSTHLIELEQAKKAPFKFTLTYGLSVKSELSYEQACMALGSALLHHACCEGKAVNTGF